MSASSSGPERSPPASDDPFGLGVPVLSLVAPLAGLAFVATVLGRAVGPAMAGIGVGMGRTIRSVEYLGDLTTQLTGILAVVLGVTQLLLIARSRLRPTVRVASVVLGGAVILGCFLASSQVDGLSLALRALLGVSASVVAIALGGSALRAPFARAPGLSILLVGVASLLRALAAGLTVRGNAAAATTLLTAGHIVSTAGFVLGALAVLVGLIWIAARARTPTNPVTLGLLFAALLLARKALLAERDDATGGTVLVARALARLVNRPEPIFPLSVQLFVAALAPLVALAALFFRAVPPRPGADPTAPRARLPASLGGAMALALLVRDAPDRPLAALFLVIAGLSIALTADDNRGLWAAIAARRS